MATSELRFAVKPCLTASELDDVDTLVREARWNQLAADWRIFTDLGRVYAAHTGADRIVATTATLPYGSRFAWISMVLVKSEFRRHGLATQLMRRAMDDLAREGRVPILDATPDGRAVYRKLGFEDSWGFARLLRRERQHTTEPFVGPAADVVVRAIGDQDWPALCAYDAAAFGADRSAVLGGLRGRLPAAEFVAEHAGRVVGFALGRDGGLAAQIGPLIADDEAIAAALLAPALDGIEGPLFVDLADGKQELRSVLDARGFASVRPFTRMLYGSSTRFDDAARTCAVIGPEFG
jgi:GNAT superfamily N-acetyltransferase